MIKKTIENDKKIIENNKKIIENDKKIIENNKKIKKNKKKWSSVLLDKKNHTKFINMLYLEENFSENKLIIKELKSKLSSYRQQDSKKNRYKKDKIITLGELFEKLVISKLSCYYCKKQCLLIYENKREKLQWTLDRKNNDIGHYNDNVVISCLECNLQKRRRNEEHFKFLKQMNIIKLKF